MSDTRFHSRDLRKGRRSETGRAYLVTVTTHDRTPLFMSLSTARCVVRAVRRLNDLGHVQSLCFVVMPDHVHWLFGLGESARLSSVINAMKSLATREVRRLLPELSKVWQRGFHDRAVRREEDLLAIARYVVGNPLRAGLVNSLGDYPHWDAVWL